MEISRLFDVCVRPFPGNGERLTLNASYTKDKFPILFSRPGSTPTNTACSGFGVYRDQRPTAAKAQPKAQSPGSVALEEAQSQGNISA
jgi:hypothetical protein